MKFNTKKVKFNTKKSEVQHLLNLTFFIAISGSRRAREDFKKRNHQNLIPDMMGAFLDGPAHSKCLENAKNGAGLENSQMLPISSQSLNGAIRVKLGFQGPVHL